MRYLQSLEEYADAYDEVAAFADAGDRGRAQDAFDLLGAVGNEQIAAAVELDLTACARRLSPAQDLAVREITERVFADPDPEASCNEDVSEQLKKNNVGRGDRCVESGSWRRTAPHSSTWPQPVLTACSPART